MNLFLHRIFGGSTPDKKETKGSCSLYKGKCGGTLKNTCCKVPFKCGKHTTICGKDKLCCITEADIQRHKQETGNFLNNRGG